MENLVLGILGLEWIHKEGENLVWITKDQINKVGFYENVSIRTLNGFA